MAYIIFNKAITKELKSGINLDINKNDFVVIKGHNSSFLIDLMQKNKKVLKGKIIVDKNDITNLSQTEKTKYTRKYLSTIFSHDDLLKNLTIEENLKLAYEISNKPNKINKYLKKLKLNKIKNNYPDELPLYKNKIASFARALVKNSPIILIKTIDDIIKDNKIEFLEILNDIKGTKTVIIETEDKDIIGIADIIINIGKTKITTKKSGDAS